MSTKPRDIRKKTELTLPCPDCGAECPAQEITKPDVQKEGTPGGAVIVLPNHYAALHCQHCNFQAWIGLDENGNSLDEDYLC